MPMRILTRLLLTLALAAALSACGNKGALVLPDKAASPASASPS